MKSAVRRRGAGTQKSLPTRGAWIKMVLVWISASSSSCRSPHGERGLKLRSRPKSPRFPTAVSQVCLWPPPCASVLQCYGGRGGNRTHWSRLCYRAERHTQRVHMMPDLHRHGFRRHLAKCKHPSWPIKIGDMRHGRRQVSNLRLRGYARYAAPSPGSWETDCTTPPYIPVWEAIIRPQ